MSDPVAELQAIADTFRAANMGVVSVVKEDGLVYGLNEKGFAVWTMGADAYEALRKKADGGAE